MAFKENRIVVTNDKDFGSLIFKQKLKSAGIEDSTIEIVLDDLADNQQWQDRARQAIAQWKKAHPKHAEDKTRHMRFLASRGFDLYLS